MTSYIEKEATKNLLELENKFRRLKDTCLFNIKKKKSTVFLYTSNEQSDNKKF